MPFNIFMSTYETYFPLLTRARAGGGAAVDATTPRMSLSGMAFKPLGGPR